MLESAGGSDSVEVDEGGFFRVPARVVHRDVNPLDEPQEIVLAVAVPAVLGYNWIVRRNKSAMERVRGFGADLHAVLLSSQKQPVRA